MHQHILLCLVVECDREARVQGSHLSACHGARQQEHGDGRDRGGCGEEGLEVATVVRLPPGGTANNGQGGGSGRVQLRTRGHARHRELSSGGPCTQADFSPRLALFVCCLADDVEDLE
jgi:hypothetical protein